MLCVSRLSQIEEIGNQSHMATAGDHGKMVREMAKHVGKTAAHALKVDADASICDMMSGRCRG